MRLVDPRGCSDLTGLELTGTEPVYRARQKAASRCIPTVAVPKPDRPLVLTDVARTADAVLANFEVSDGVLLDIVFRKRSPGNELPFSEEEVQLGDVPDTAHPLHERGYGPRYRPAKGR